MLVHVARQGGTGSYFPDPANTTAVLSFLIAGLQALNPPPTAVSQLIRKI